jgi:hypothetical protein
LNTEATLADQNDGVRPDQAEANRARMQGGGSGQREMDAQQDPTGARGGLGGEARSFEADPISQTGTNPQEASAHIVEGGDQYDTEGRDNPQADGGEPSMGAQHGQTHVDRPERAQSEAGGQGPKTRARNKEINSGGL